MSVLMKAEHRLEVRTSYSVSVIFGGPESRDMWTVKKVCQFLRCKTQNDLPLRRGSRPLALTNRRAVACSPAEVSPITTSSLFVEPGSLERDGTAARRLAIERYVRILRCFPDAKWWACPPRYVVAVMTMGS
jgi:hypothetical protein